MHRREILLLVGVVVITFCARSLTFHDRLLDRDEAYWLSSARRAQAFDLPGYLAGWDTKPPAIFLFYGLALDVVPGAPLLVTRLSAALIAAGIAAWLTRCVTGIKGTLCGLVTGGTFILLDSGGAVRALACGTETLSYLSVTTGMALSVRPSTGSRVSTCAMGVLSTLAVMCKAHYCRSLSFGAGRPGHDSLAARRTVRHGTREGMGGRTGRRDRSCAQRGGRHRVRGARTPGTPSPA